MRIVSHLKIADGLLRNSKLGRIILFGDEKLQEDLDIVNIVRRLRNLNTLARVTDLASV